MFFFLFFFFYIVQLLNDEYGAMSPGSLEAQGLISASEYQKVAALTQSASPDAHKKIAGKHTVGRYCLFTSTDIDFS